MLNFCRLRNICHIKRKNFEFLSDFRHLFHHEFEKPDGQITSKVNETQKLQNQRQTPPSFRLKYKEFKDVFSSPILDVEEEKLRFQMQDEPEQQEDVYLGLNVNRGLNGVFDIEDLVDVLRKENIDDIFVCSVPKEVKYVDYMVVCSGRSYRHMLATAEFVRHMYKVKRNKGDILPKIEGEKSRDWMAIDLGNIALHIFTPKVREQYDLESLWAIGAEYDKPSNALHDSFEKFYDRPMMLLSDIKPLK